MYLLDFPLSFLKLLPPSRCQSAVMSNGGTNTYVKYRQVLSSHTGSLNVPHRSVANYVQWIRRCEEEVGCA